MRASFPRWPLPLAALLVAAPVVGADDAERTVLAGPEDPSRFEVDANGDAVWGPSIKPEDDLWLEYDMWATALEGGTHGKLVDADAGGCPAEWQTWVDEFLAGIPELAGEAVTP